ncbi:MAG: DNA (cytosine-5-)-methyltransferase, partial [Lentisphaerae bacterium]|nr:DNA (cytosine-5-)-methyltransferase [Lentisphaerota bacterium]
NRPSWNVICDDIENIDFNEFKGIDFVSGGFPCQAFSYAGKRFGFEDTRGTLFFEFARAIKEINPKVFLGENVRGLLTHDSGKTIAVIKAVISELGYTLVEPHILKAIFYGVPQKRERLALVGVRNDLAHHLKKFAWPSYYHRVFTVRDALIKGELYDCDVPDSEGVSYAGWRKEILEHVPQGGYWRNLPRDLQKKLLKGSFHLAGGKTGIGRRLSWDEPSLTLTCAPAQNQTGRCHPEETRPLTVREYARIQTFPDDWRFSGSVMSQYRQIGNAVPVNLAAALGRSLIALLNSIEGELPKEKKEANLEFLDSFVTVKYGVKTPDKLVQGMLFDANSLYLVDSSPVTLLGTYRKVCRKWIIENNLYNYPVKEEELDSIQELLAVRRLVLARKRDQLLSFNVTGYSLVRKKELAELGYSVSKRSSEKQRYILYSLEPADSFPIKLDGKVVAIVGKGVRV